jgi:hypothetical protein
MSRTKKDSKYCKREDWEVFHYSIARKSKIKKAVSKTRRAKEKNALRTEKDVKVFKKDILWWYF